MTKTMGSALAITVVAIILTGCPNPVNSDDGSGGSGGADGGAEGGGEARVEA